MPVRTAWKGATSTPAPVSSDAAPRVAVGSGSTETAPEILQAVTPSVGDDAVALLEHGVPVGKDDVPVGAADRDEQRVLRQFRADLGNRSTERKAGLAAFRPHRASIVRPIIRNL